MEYYEIITLKISIMKIDLKNNNLLNNIPTLLF